jgi:tetratricopeptide (TPR) repeat protein
MHTMPFLRFPDPPSVSRADRRTGRAARSAVLLLVLVVAGVLAWRFKNELRYGRAEPPALSSKALEPALQRRLEERTAQVRGQPYSAQAWGALAVAYDVHEMQPEAIVCYERAERLDPRDWRWPYFLALCTRIGDQEASLAQLRDAAELKPDYAPLWFYVGNGELKRERLDEADVAFAKAVALDPKLIAAHLGRAQVELARKDAPAALKHLERAVDLRPKTNEAKWLLAQTYRLLGDDAKAKKYAPDGIAPSVLEPLADPVRSELQLQEGVTARWRIERSERSLQQGQPDAAIAEYEALVKDAPGSSDAHRSFGDLYARLDRRAQAREMYAAALRLDADNAAAHLGLANLASREDKPDEAIAELRSALALDPELHAAKSNLGALLMSQGHADEGLGLLREAAKALPEDGDALFNLAQGLRTAGLVDEAQEVLQRVIAVDPTNLRARFELGTLLGSKGNLREAAEQFREVTRGEPQLLSAHTNLIRALREQKQYAEMLAAARAANEAIPEHPQLMATLAWILATSPDEKVRDGAEALKVATRLNELSEAAHTPPQVQSEFLVVLAAAQAESGDFDAATATAKKALDLVPRDQPVVTEVGKVKFLDKLFACIKRFEAKQAFRDAD